MQGDDAARGEDPAHVDEAYTYLPNSVKRFPDAHSLGGVMAGCGLRDVGWILTAGGIIAIHHGRVE